MKNIEDQIRDKLAGDLSVIDQNLVLIDTEFYIPELYTTKSFIDILAKDENNNYIIIEIKRSNQSVRQAIHEIYKYTEAIKGKYKVTDGEIKVLLISTEWKELYIPFSAFANESKISIQGINVTIDDNFNITSKSKIEPCKTDKGRLFSPIQKCCLYLTNENLQKGILSHKKVFQKKKIQNYVLVILKGAEFDELLYKEKMEKMFAELLGKDKDEFKGSFDKMELHRYMIYSAFQRLSKEEYYDILSQDKVELEETKEYIELLELDDESDVLSQLEVSVMSNLKPYFYSDSVEVGKPAKFAHKILEDEKWEILEIIRSESLNNNFLLTDKKIISEISGYTGVTNVVLKDSCSIKHKAKFNEIKSFIDNALKFNVVWLNQIKQFINDIEKLVDYEIYVEIFNPYNVILTLTHMVVKEEPLNYIPNYSLEVSNGSHKKIFFGSFHWNGRYPDFDDIVDRYYDGDAANIIMKLMWRGHEENNDLLLDELGISYESYMIEEKNGEIKYFHLKNYKFIKVKGIENGLVDFYNFNEDFMRNLLLTYKTYYHETKIDIKNN